MLNVKASYNYNFGHLVFRIKKGPPRGKFFFVVVENIQISLENSGLAIKAQVAKTRNHFPRGCLGHVDLVLHLILVEGQ